MSRSIRWTVGTSLALCVIRLLARLDLQFVVLLGSQGPIIGAAAGFVVGLLFGAMQVRYEAASGKHTPGSSSLSSLGGALLVLSVGSFIATRFVKGLRPTVLASAPIHVD